MVDVKKTRMQPLRQIHRALECLEDFGDSVHNLVRTSFAQQVAPKVVR